MRIGKKVSSLPHGITDELAIHVSMYGKWVWLMGFRLEGAQTGGWNNDTLYFRARNYTYIIATCSFVITGKKLGF